MFEEFIEVVKSFLLKNKNVKLDVAIKSNGDEIIRSYYYGNLNLCLIPDISKKYGLSINGTKIDSFTQEQLGELHKLLEEARGPELSKLEKEKIAIAKFKV